MMKDDRMCHLEVDWYKAEDTEAELAAKKTKMTAGKMLL